MSWPLLGYDLSGAVGGGEVFGNSVSLSADGNYVAVGSPAFDGGKGRAQVFYYSSGIWTQVGSAVTGLSDENSFGTEVSLSSDGQILAVRSNTSAFVFSFGSSGWVPVGSAITSNTSIESITKISLSPNGTRLAILKSVLSGFENNYVSILEVFDGEWIVPATISAAHFDANSTLTLGSNILMIHSTGNVLLPDSQQYSSGIVKVFSYDGQSWSQKGSSFTSFVPTEALTSADLSADGTKIVIGTSLYDSFRGRATVYTFSNGDWVQEGTPINGILPNDYFGSNVKIAGNGEFIAVSASNANGGNGSIVVFRLKNGSWLQYGSVVTGNEVGYGLVIAFSSNGQKFASGFASANTSDGKVQVFSLVQSVPDAPTNVTAEAGSSNATVSFTPPVNDGGSDITSYAVEAYEGEATTGTGISNAGPNSPIIVTGLTPDVVYKFKVTAINAIGQSVPSDFSNNVTPWTETVPDAPSQPTCVATYDSIIVSFSPPEFDGHQGILGYNVYAYLENGTDTGIAASGPNSPIAVTGLTEGESYIFKVEAANGQGYSLKSEFSTPAISLLTRTEPGQILDVVATGGNMSATITFTEPSNDGGSAITGYKINAYLSMDSSPVSTQISINSTYNFTGLTNGTYYYFTVSATNAIGDSIESPRSMDIIAGTVPDAPTGVSAVSGISKATVSFTAPYDGGSAISEYTVEARRSDTNALVNTATGIESPIEVTGLTNGVFYIFRVKAANFIGESLWSDYSSSVAPAALLGAPSAPNAVAGARSATLNFNPPAVPSHTSILGYNVRVYNTANVEQVGLAVTTNTSSRPIVVTGLTANSSYKFKIAARNTSGTGTFSAYTNTITVLADVPGIPTITNIETTYDTAVVSFNEPADNGGAAITGYTVNAYSAADNSPIGSASDTVSPITLSGLPMGTLINFKILATNNVDSGPESAATSAQTLTPLTPSAPSITSVTTGIASATVYFTEPADAAETGVFGYTVKAYLTSDDTFSGLSWSDMVSPITVNNLLSTSYYFKVFATTPYTEGPESDASPNYTIVSSSVPSAPTNVSVTAGNSSVTVTFTPGSDGGSPVSLFTVNAYLGSDWNAYNPMVPGPAPTPVASATGGSSPILVSGLTNGTSYVFNVYATNGMGDGPVSTAVSASAGIVADPYVTTVNGTRYKLPSVDAPIRVFQGEVEGKTLTINAQLRTIPNDALMVSNFRSYFDLKSKVPAAKLKVLEKSVFNTSALCFFEKFYISYNGAALTLNVWDQKFKVESYEGGELPVSAVDGKHLTGKTSDIYKDYACKTLKFKIGSDAAVFVSVYDSPMLRNGIFLEGINMTQGNGAIVNVLSSKDMTLVTLDSAVPVAKRDARMYVKHEAFTDKDGYREKKIYVTK